MTPAQIETVYDALAIRLDAAGPARRDLFLAKLVLLLARDLGDVDSVLRRIDDAAQDLDASRP